MTKAAPSNSKVWLVQDDAASHRVTLNGTISGNAIKATPEIPTTKRDRPRRNGKAGLAFSVIVVKMPEAMTNKPTRRARVIPCEAHLEWMLGWIFDRIDTSYAERDGKKRRRNTDGAICKSLQ